MEKSWTPCVSQALDAIQQATDVKCGWSKDPCAVPLARRAKLTQVMKKTWATSRAKSARKSGAWSMTPKEQVLQRVERHAKSDMEAAAR